MSSLAATQADGYYVPPEQLDAGAYKPKSNHNQYLQRSVVRFELPFDGFCTGCDSIVGKGTRFNAHKAHVDNYFTSKIYEFTTKCRSCGKVEFKIRTNPKDQTFDYILGIRKKIEEFDSTEAGTLGVIDTEIGTGIHQFKNGDVAISSTDESQNTGTRGALHLLEKNAAGHRKTLTEHDQMVSLLQLNSKMGEDADANAAVRASFRKDRKAKKQRFSDAANIGLGRGIELLTGVTEEDQKNAKTVMQTRERKRGTGNNHAHRSERDLFQNKRSESIFATEKKSNSRRRGQKQIVPKNSVGDSESTNNTNNNLHEKPRQKRKIDLNAHNQTITVASNEVDKSKKSDTCAQEKSTNAASGGSSLLALCDYGSDSE